MIWYYEDGCKVSEGNEKFFAFDGYAFFWYQVLHSC